MNQDKSVTGRIIELSLGGCRVRSFGKCPQGTPAGIMEVLFKINGIAFRLAGTVQWTDAGRTAGIRFRPMASRRREALEELLAELEASELAKAAATAPPENEPKPSPGQIQALPLRKNGRRTARPGR